MSNVMVEQEPKEWSLAQLMGFRFLFSYLILFYFPFPSGLVNPYWLGGLFNKVWDAIVPWFAANVIHVQLPDLNNGGSGDSTFDYVRVLCTLMLAALSALIWSVLDRRRTDYRNLYGWSRIWLRYALALCMLTFGAVKVLMVQFEPPGYGRLVEPLGQFSPMALLWTFMGYSKLYTSFTGITEVLAGVLLFFRKTTTLGALLVTAIMSNVLMLNLGYDVPVKLGSMHVLLLALVLLGPELGRLLNFFVLNRATTPTDLGPYIRSKAAARAAMAVKALAVCSILSYLAWDTTRSYNEHLAILTPDPVPPLGWYRVASLKKDGQEVQPLTSSDLRWKTVSIREGIVGLRSVDGTLQRFRPDGDPLHGPVNLYPLDDKMKPIAGAPPAGKIAIRIEREGQAILSGIFDSHTIEATLQRENPADMPLMSRGFRWITETPYFH